MTIIDYENHDIRRVDVALSLYDPMPWLEGFKCLNQSHCPGWRYLNVHFSVTACRKQDRTVII